MALQSSGAISLSQIETEFGGSAPTSLSEYYAAAAGIPGNNNPLSLSDFYGTASLVGIETIATPVIINGQNSLQQITVSDYISSGGSLSIPASWWIWSDSTSVAAMTIDIPCTIINNGKIIGKGGNGAGTSGYNGGAGGPAIRINSGVSGVTIENVSGAFIAGGGGGGGTSNANAQAKGPGGGGAGGGNGGNAAGTSNQNLATGHVGAVLNAAAAQSISVTSQTAQAGGTGGYRAENSSGTQYGRKAGGGGRILPGADCNPTVQFITQAGNIATGGAGGQNGTNGRRSGDTVIGAGGGGWGAAGGNGANGRTTNGSGGAGGKAVEDTGNTYTLTNNGTMFGATT
jgi:hypothetical protein